MPPKGSLQESVLVLYVLKKEQIEHARLRALAQAMTVKEKAKEAFEDYMKVAFPWLETQKKREYDAARAVLMKEIASGQVLGVKPLWMKSSSSVRSRLVKKVEASSADRARLDRLYGERGRVVPR